MKKLIFALFMFAAVKAHCAYTDWFIDPGAVVGSSNVYVGDGNTVVTAAGSWTNGTSSFTATSGTPFSGASVGQFASIYAVGAATTSYIARITAIQGNNTLILSGTNSAGTKPATGNYNCTLGGTWLGPVSGNSATAQFPWSIVTSNLVDTSADNTRVNIHNTSTYTITSTIVPVTAANGVIVWQGYSNTPGDGGKAVIGAAGASVQMFNANQMINQMYADISFKDCGFSFFGNGATSGNNLTFFRDKFSNGAQAALVLASFANVIYCEFTNMDFSNTSTGIVTFNGNNGIVALCNFHDNPGSNVEAIRAAGASVSIFCNKIVGTGKYSVNVTNVNAFSFSAFNTIDGSGNDAITFTGAAGNVNAFVINNMLANNGGYAINGSVTNNIFSINNGFYLNTSGSTGTTSINEINDINLTENPYFNSSTQDYRVKSQQLIGKGFGTFPGSSILSYPTPGAYQPQPFPGGVAVLSY